MCMVTARDPVRGEQRTRQVHPGGPEPVMPARRCPADISWATEGSLSATLST